MRTLPALLAASVSWGTVAAADDACTAVPVIDDRCERWVSIHDGHGGQSVAGGDAPVSIAASPDGARVYTLATTKRLETDDDATVVAYGASDGVFLWSSTFASPGRVADSAAGLALAGDTLFVTALTEVGGEEVTVVRALDATSGAERWSRKIAVEGAMRTVLGTLTPAGDTLYLGGSAVEPPAGEGEGPDTDALLLAVDAGTGEESWRAREEGLTASGSDTVVALAVPPSRDRVVAEIASQARRETTFDLDFLTIAFEAEDEDHLGETLWRARFDGGAAGQDLPADLELSPDGETAYVAGSSIAAGSDVSDYDFVVRSYGVADGAVGFTARYDGPMAGFDVASDLALSGDGRTLVTAGLSGRLPQSLGAGNTTLGAWAATGSGDFAVVGHDAATGEERWVARYEPAGFPYTSPVGVAVAGGRAYVTGFSYSGALRSDVATIAVDIADGSVDWTARYNSHDTTKDFDQPAAIAGAAGRVFVAARLAYTATPPGGNAVDLGTLAYDA